MKTNTYQRFIHIKAVSEIYSVLEIVPEQKAVKRLETIRDHFNEQKVRFWDKFPDSSLTVTTCVVNPELPMRH